MKKVNSGTKTTRIKRAKPKRRKFEVITELVSCAKIGGKRGDFYSVGKDEDGYFVFTHRARSKSYASVEKIPVKTKLSIGSTA